MDHDLTSAVAAAIPLVLRHIPPTPAAELGRLGDQRPARMPKQRDSPVSGALRGVRVVDRLLGALELPVEALHVPVPRDLVAHLVPRQGVVGTALGAAALLLADLPMPPAYRTAVLAKRRADYHYPRWSSATPAVRDHWFALAEGPVADDVDFSANGLVAVVPGGVVVRTGLAEGHVSASLHVFAERPPEVDLLGWDEVVEVSWTAQHGEATLGGRDTTPPWPGDYRVLVQATGRDEGIEDYYVTVWAAPAADTVVHKRTDRLGHRLRGEPEPPVVVAPDRAHWWIESSSLQVAATVTFVVGLSADEVLRAFGADPDEPEPLEDLRYHGGDPWVAVREFDGFVLAFEENGYLGTRDAVLERLSRNGKAASAFWNVNAVTRLSFARDGEVLASFEPGPCPSDDPEVRAAFDALDLVDRRHRDAKLVTAAALFAGRAVTEAEFDAVQVAHFATG